MLCCPTRDVEQTEYLFGRAPKQLTATRLEVASLGRYIFVHGSNPLWSDHFIFINERVVVGRAGPGLVSDRGSQQKNNNLESQHIHHIRVCAHSICSSRLMCNAFGAVCQRVDLMEIQLKHRKVSMNLPQEREREIS